MMLSLIKSLKVNKKQNSHAFIEIFKYHPFICEPRSVLGILGRATWCNLRHGI
jgi:hypothetical protein